jgi:hypothetical protein
MYVCFVSDRLRIYFNQGECVTLYTAKLADCDEVKEIVSRLEVVTTGCQVTKLPALNVQSYKYQTGGNPAGAAWITIASSWLGCDTS